MSNPTTLDLGRVMSVDRMSVGLSRRIGATALTLMGLVVGVLVWRRLAGALDRPLSIGQLAVLGLVLAVVAVAIRWLYGRDADRPFDRLIPWCPTVFAIAIGVAVHLPGTSPTGLALLWSVLVFEEVADRLRPWRRRGVCPLDRSTDKPGDVESGCAEPPVLDAAWTPVMRLATADVDREPAEQPPVVLESPPESHVTQQFVRTGSADGRDVFSGWLRVEMPPHGRATHVHVAFCPPFARTPTVEVHQADGPAGRIKTVQALPYGVRLDLKLNQSHEEATTVLLRFVASL